MKRLYLFFVLFIPLVLNAQTLLTLRNAIDTALKNNLDIQIVKNNVQIARENNTYGMAGGLPYLNANFGDNVLSNNINQKINTGSETNYSGILGNTINAGISANIILFNGFKVLATKKRLSYIQKQSEIELNGQIQDIIAAIMIKYYNIIRQQSYLRIIQSVLDVSQKKLEIINKKNSVGMANGADIMQAQSDVNTAEQNLTIQKMNIYQEKADLQLLMNTKTNLTYIINDSIVIDNILLWDTIANSLKKNPQYLSAEQQVKISQQVLKETKAQLYPSLKLNTAYNYNRTDNNSGYTLLNQNYGASAGLILQIPIFNGMIYHTQKIVAGLNIRNSKLEQEKLYKTITNIAIKNYLSYTTIIKQIESQQNNFELSKKLVDLVMQNFQNGQATILELKAAQASFENAAYQLVNYQYEAKPSEVLLKQLIYNLSY